MGKSKKGSDLFEKIRITAENLTTLEINTVIKEQMTATTTPDNNRMALYQLAGTYAAKIEELGDKYRSLQLASSAADTSDENHSKANPFRTEKVFLGGGIFSFRELSLWAKHAIEWIKDHTVELGISQESCADDIRLLARIEIKSIEVSRILELTLENDPSKTNPMSYRKKKKELGLSDEDILKIDNQEVQAGLPLDIRRLDTLYKILLKKNKIDIPEKEGDFLTYESDKDIVLDLKHRMVIHKSLDLGTEIIVMQTRISLDGDIITRISDKFAADPKQFVLDMHNASIDMAVGYWGKIFDALIGFMNKVLSWKFPK